MIVRYGRESDGSQLREVRNALKKGSQENIGSCGTKRAEVDLVQHSSNQMPHWLVWSDDSTCPEVTEVRDFGGY